MFLDIYYFNDTLNLDSGTFTLNFTITAFQILALKVEKVCVSSEARSMSFVLVL